LTVYLAHALAIGRAWAVGQSCRNNHKQRQSPSRIAAEDYRLGP